MQLNLLSPHILEICGTVVNHRQIDAFLALIAVDGKDSPSQITVKYGADNPVSAQPSGSKFF